MHSGKRSAAAREAKRDRIKAVAQALFAEGGLKNVSTRDIISAAGYRNTTLINYYFGSKAALIDELINDVATSLSQHRQQELAQLKAQGGPGIRDLLVLLATPAPVTGLSEEAAKSRTRFTAMLLIYHRDSLFLSGMYRKDTGTALCIRELRRLLPRKRGLTDRINLVLLMFVAALVNDEVENAGDGPPASLRIRNKNAVIDAAIAILTGPAGA